MTELTYHETPVVALRDPIAAAAGIELCVKREDLNHPEVSGNKWWKLTLNLSHALAQKHHTLLTFGGGHSNHIYAAASAAAAVGLRSIGVIRGVYREPLNSTLDFARGKGMELHFVPKSLYRERDELQAELTARYGRFYLVPEGGSNEAGVSGVSMFVKQLPSDFDYVCCPVGTGATLAGLVRGFKGTSYLIGFPVLKGGDSWCGEVTSFGPQYDNWTIMGDYHGGGYAKTHPVLDGFIEQFGSLHDLPLEPVYSGKMFFGIMDLISKGFFKKGSRILAIHTGGIR